MQWNMRKRTEEGKEINFFKANNKKKKQIITLNKSIQYNIMVFIIIITILIIYQKDRG